MAESLTVAVACYGDHAVYAERCLRSVERVMRNAAAAGRAVDLRIGVNVIGDDTRKIVLRTAEAVSQFAPARVYEEATAGRNVYKYPMMRAMVAVDPAPVGRDLLWMDDDSYFRPSGEIPERQGDTLLGSRYSLDVGRAQVEWIKSKPWYAGRPLGLGRRMGTASILFATGGWWMVETAFLRSVDYPFLVLRNKGGDWSLGEAIRQQGRSIDQINFANIGINTAIADRRESSAPTRGPATPLPSLAGEAEVARHYDFELTVRRYEGGSCKETYRLDLTTPEKAAWRPT